MCKEDFCEVFGRCEKGNIYQYPFSLLFNVYLDDLRVIGLSLVIGCIFPLTLINGINLCETVHRLDFKVVTYSLIYRNIQKKKRYVYEIYGIDRQRYFLNDFASII